MEFKRETLADCLEEMKPLLEDHYQEVAMYQEHIELDPDYDLYYLIEDQGNLAIYTARHNDVIIGYSIFFLKAHPHYKTHTYAVNDIVYVHPDFRHDGTAVDFFSYVEAEVKQIAEVITYHMKTFKTFESLMDHLDYDKAEFLFSKYLWQ